METLTVRSEGLVLDAILARRFGAVRGRELVAATLDLNPGLAAAGPILPIGTVIILPERPVSSGPASRSVVSLFEPSR